MIAVFGYIALVGTNSNPFLSTSIPFALIMVDCFNLTVAMNSYACFFRGRKRFAEAEKLEAKLDEIWKAELVKPTWRIKH